MVIDTTHYVYPKGIYRYFSSSADFLTLFTEWYVESLQQGGPCNAALVDHVQSCLGIDSAEDSCEGVDTGVHELEGMFMAFAHQHRGFIGQLKDVAHVKAQRGRQGEEGVIPETLIVSSMDYMSNGGRYVTIN